MPIGLCAHTVLIKNRVKKKQRTLPQDVCRIKIPVNECKGGRFSSKLV